MKRTPAELEHYFETIGKQRMLHFFYQFLQNKKSIQRERPSNINATQAHVLALIQKGTKHTAALMECTGLGRRTINQALLKLRNEGLVTMEGAGNKITYHSKGA